MEGRIIAIDGIDQAGKKVQCHELEKRLNERFKVDAIMQGRTQVAVFSFPDYGNETGKLIARFLGGTLHLEPRAVRLLYAANKWEEVPVILDQLKLGDFIIMDRYVPANIAYGMAQGIPEEWIASLESTLPPADLTFIIDIDPQHSFERKPGDRDAYERKLDYLKRVRDNFLYLAMKHKWVVICDNGRRSIEDISQEIWTFTSKQFGLGETRHGKQQ